MILLISYTLIAILILSLITTLVFYLINGIAPTPSSRKVFVSLKDELPKNIDGDIVEAGAGWGGVALWLAHRYPNNTVYAWENAWLPFVVLWMRAKWFKEHNLRVRCGNFRHQSLENVGLVYNFLCRKGMKSVAQWVERYPHAEFLLVSHAFHLPGYSPYHTLPLSRWVGDQLYFYSFSPLRH